MKYEYKFVEVPLREKGFKTKLGEGFDRCKEIIIEEAANGWRLKQIVIPANEKTGVAASLLLNVILISKVLSCQNFVNEELTRSLKLVESELLRFIMILVRNVYMLRISKIMRSKGS